MMLINSELNDLLRILEKDPHFKAESFKNLLEDTDEQTVLRILARYQVTIAECIERVKSAIANQDSETIWKLSHKVAGTADLLGFWKFGHISRNLSSQVKANPIVQNHDSEIQNFMVIGQKISADISTGCPSLLKYLA